VQAAVAGELGQPQRAARVRDDLRRWVVDEAERLELPLQPLVELVAVAGQQLGARDSLRRVLRMEVERQPVELGPVPGP
jgi:hypothetical protein